MDNMAKKKIVLTEERLREIIKKSIRAIIEESMGINEPMEQEVWKMTKFIRGNISKAESMDYHESGRKYKRLSYKHEYEGKEFLWTISAVIYSDKEISEGKTIPCDAFSSSEGVNIFFGWITFPISEKGWYNVAEVADSIFHEMLHLLKSKKYGNRAKWEDFVAQSNKDYNEGEGLTKAVGTICYLSNTDEQDAFANGFYGQLKADFYEEQSFDINDGYMKSELYLKTKELRKAIIEVENADEEELKKCLQPYNGLSKTKLLSLGRRAVKRIEKKTALIMNHFEMFLWRMGFHSTKPYKIINI